MKVASHNKRKSETSVSLNAYRDSRPWGEWRILNQGEGYKVKLIEVHPGHRLSLQYHRHRAEHWVVVAGRARVVIGGKTRQLDILESALIPTGIVHRIENPFDEPLRIIEVQKGKHLLEEDIVRLEDDYARAEGAVS